MKISAWQTLVGLLCLFCSCREASPGKPVIAVSFDSYKRIAEEIVGDDYEIISLLPPGSDPEMFDPDMATMKALERADLYLTTNSLGFETQVGDRIRLNYPDLETVDISEGINLIMHTHGIASASGQSSKHVEECGHEHGRGEAHVAGDPHLLSSWSNASVIARNIGLAVAENALRAGDSDASERYLSNTSMLQTSFDSIYVETAERLTHAGIINEGSFVVMHPSLSYYARDYGLSQIPLEMDGKEATPRQLEERLKIASESNPLVLFYDMGQPEAKAREIAGSLGIEAYPVSMTGYDFMEQVEEVTNKLLK